MHTFPNLIDTTKPWYLHLYRRALDVGFDLFEIAHTFERKVFRVRTVNPQPQVVIKHLLAKRLRQVVKGYKRLHKKLGYLCNMLPRAALLSPTVFFDCLMQIIQSPKPQDYYDGYSGTVQKFSKVMRSGIFLLNHTGRVFFKYLLQYSLDKYRSLVLDERVNFYEQPMIRRLAVQSEFYTHYCKPQDRELGQVRRSIESLSESPIL